MSHNVTLSNVPFMDEGLMKEAARSLGFPLRKNADCRGYAGSLTKCDYVLVLPDVPPQLDGSEISQSGREAYDLGFNKVPETGAFVPMCDFWDGRIAYWLGDAKKIEALYEANAERELIEAACIGKFTQAYNRANIIRTATNEGLQYTEAVLSDGTVKLTLYEGGL